MEPTNQRPPIEFVALLTWISSSIIVAVYLQISPPAVLGGVSLVYLMITAFIVLLSTMGVMAAHAFFSRSVLAFLVGGLLGPCIVFGFVGIMGGLSATPGFSPFFLISCAVPGGLQGAVSYLLTKYPKEQRRKSA
ncbi:hypothetical protein [Neoaquamicrobium sediminum]|uniref:hypothetical protein n=1 Tax=Neoaquamicrobium sediminum TaxID=1849104 RepID=UPI003616D7BB